MSDAVVFTVPWDPESVGHISGRVIRAVRMAGEIAVEKGWTAAALRADVRWLDGSFLGALTRTAVRWGLVP